MGPNGTVAAPPQETQVNLDNVFLDDFRVAFRVGRLCLVLNAISSPVDSIGWKPRARNWIWRPSAFPPRSVNPRQPS
jgi:hypothetical protein